MKHITLFSSFLVLYTIGFSDQVPYTSGKISGSFDITFSSPSSFSPTIMQIGNIFSITPYYASAGLAVCSHEDENGLQVMVPGGGVYRQSNGDTNWSAYNSFPIAQNSLQLLDSVPKDSAFLSSPSPFTKARGYIIGYPGDNQCMSSTYRFDDNYAQVIFIVKGNVYAKMKIWSYVETTGGTFQYPSQTLNKLTLRYVVSDNANDLMDVPSAILFNKYQSKSFSTDEFDFYNILGIRLGINLSPNVSALPVNSRNVRLLHRATQ